LIVRGAFTTPYLINIDYSAFKPECEHVSKHNYIGVSINYHLTDYYIFTKDPKPWPDQLTDAKMAIAWLRRPENILKYKIDPNRIFVVGHSAGS
jgi:acetyl esterase/lipase